MHIFTVPASDQGTRLDRFLKKQFPKCAITQFYPLIRKKKVSVNGKNKTDFKYSLRSGDEVKIFVAEDFFQQALQKREDKLIKKTHFEILHEDGDLMVVLKPAGMITSGAEDTSEISLLDEVRHYLGDGSKAQVVHRLDRDTAGCVIIAKKREISDYFYKLFKQRKVHKEYLVLCHGKVVPANGTINTPLKKDDQGQQKVFVSNLQEGKEAITHYEVEECLGDYSLLRVQIETGRTHQIRVHLASIGHPVCFDRQYGDWEKDKALKEQCSLKHQFLFAEKLSFIHPSIGKQLEIVAKLPANMEECIHNISRRK